MNQPTIKTALKLITAVIITFGLSLAVQSVLAVWNNPTCPPPGCNVPAPVNVGSSTASVHGQQAMYDGLSISEESVIATSSGLTVAGMLAVGADKLYVQGIVPPYNIGIGTANPQRKLHIDGGANSYMRFDTNAGDDWVVGADGYGYIVFSETDGAYRMVVDTNGNVGVGTINPSEKLTVAGGHGDTKLRLYSTGDGAGSPANLSLWASEPGWTYYGTGIGYNVKGSPYYGRIDSTRGSSYVRFLPGETKFEFQNTSDIYSSNVLTLKESGYVGIGTPNPAQLLTVGSTPGGAANAFYDIGAGKMAVGTSFYSYGSICAGNTAGDCTGTGGVVVTGTGIKFPDATVQTTAGGGGGQWATNGNDISNANIGNVGIGGVPAAGSKLQVQKTSGDGNAGSFNASGGASNNVGIYATANGGTLARGGIFAATGGVANWAIYTVDASPPVGPNNYAIYSSSEAQSFFDGNVGIGVQQPVKRLDVAGDALINGLTVGTGNGNNISNTAFGYQSLLINSSGAFNTGIGERALYSNLGGLYNTANGAFSQFSNNNGGNNTSQGYFSLYTNTGGNTNTAIGAYSLQNNITGSANAALGYSSLNTNTTGVFNTAIGYFADVASGNLMNATAIGYGANVNASNKVRIGNTSITVIEGQVGLSVTSDGRLKHDIADSDLGLDFINKLHPVSYKLNNGDDGINYGFIAQEVERAIGKPTNIIMSDESPEKMKTMRYDDLIAPVVKAIQEQQQQIEDLKAQIEVLKNDN